MNSKKNEKQDQSTMQRSFDNPESDDDSRSSFYSTTTSKSSSSRRKESIVDVFYKILEYAEMLVADTQPSLQFLKTRSQYEKYIAFQEEFIQENELDEDEARKFSFLIQTKFHDIEKQKFEK